VSLAMDTVFHYALIRCQRNAGYLLPFPNGAACRFRKAPRLIAPNSCGVLTVYAYQFSS